MRPSVSRDSKGLRIDLELPSGKRATLRLRRFGVTKRQDYEAVAVRLAELIASKNINIAASTTACEWLQGLDGNLYRRLQQWGLVPSRDRDITLHDLLDLFFGTVAKSTKPGTLNVRNRAVRHAKRFFPPQLMVSAMTVEDGLEFRNWMLGLPGQQGRSMSEHTVRKTCGVIHQALRYAVRRGIITVSPFADQRIPKTAGRNSERHEYVSRDSVLLMMGAAPSAEHRLLIGLGRYAALRLPSEAVDLKWEDIDWSRRVMRVRSPKTMHVPGKEQRDVPIFPELYRLLEEAKPLDFNQSDYLLPYLRLHSNLNMVVRRIGAAAGINQYPKALHALRASCETDWLRQFKQPDVAASWTGHSVQVMYEHYIHLDASAAASEAAIQVARERGDPGGDQSGEFCLSMVVTPSAAGKGQRQPSKTQAPPETGLVSSTDEFRELVSAGVNSSADADVDLIGLEPTTSSMPWMRSSN
jgi:integrase